MSADHVYCAPCGTVLHLDDIESPTAAIADFSRNHATCGVCPNPACQDDSVRGAFCFVCQGVDPFDYHDCGELTCFNSQTCAHRANPEGNLR